MTGKKNSTTPAIRWLIWSELHTRIRRQLEQSGLRKIALANPMPLVAIHPQLEALSDLPKPLEHVLDQLFGCSVTQHLVEGWARVWYRRAELL